MVDALAVVTAAVTAAVVDAIAVAAVASAADAIDPVRNTVADAAAADATRPDVEEAAACPDPDATSNAPNAGCVEQSGRSASSADR